MKFAHLPLGLDRRSVQRWLGVGLGVLAANPAWATDYYVATDGDDSNDGTVDRPFATIQAGQAASSPGDTVFIRGGTYRITTPDTPGAGIVMNKSGTSDTARIS